MPGKPIHIPTKRQLERAAAEGWADRIRSSQDEIAVARGCYYDSASAEATVNFFPRFLSHGKAPFAGHPFKLLDWQAEGIIRPIYGWKMDDGTRRYLSAYVEIPKKNGKTQIAAGIAHRELQEQYGARVFITAVARHQAADCFDEAAGMVKRNADLAAFLDVRESTYRILYPDQNGFILALGTDGGSSQGKNASCLILDELHEWKDRAFFNSLMYADAARINSLIFSITTAGDDLTGLCYEEHERAERIIAGKDPSFDHLAIIYAAKPDAKYDDLQAWKDANPSYGITLPVRKIEKSITDANGSPQKQANLKRYRLNIWTQPRDSWLDVAHWDELGHITEADLRGQECRGGLDIARTQDFAGWARCFPYRDGVAFLFRLWIPHDRIAEKEKSDKIPLAAWINAGYVQTTDGDEIDQDQIRKDIKADHAKTPIGELGFDPYNARHLANAQLAGGDGIQVIEVPQTMPYMGPPSAEFERAFKARKIYHDHNPAVSWMAGNVIVYEDANENIRPMKRRSRGRIDGITAAIISLSRHHAKFGAISHMPTYYDSHEVEMV